MGDQLLQSSWIVSVELAGEGRKLAARHFRPSTVSAASFSSFCRLLSLLTDAEARGKQAPRKPQGVGRALQAGHKGVSPDGAEAFFLRRVLKCTPVRGLEHF